MAWSVKVCVSRIPKLGSFLVILQVLIMATERMEMVEAITNTGDIQALKQVSNNFLKFCLLEALDQMQQNSSSSPQSKHSYLVKPLTW